MIPSTVTLSFNPVETLMRNRFRHVILHITERCNLRCKTCFVHKRGREMSAQDAGRIAEKLGPVRWLDIGGGEPFLHPDLAAVCALFPNSEITIPTNGQDPKHICDTAREIAVSATHEVTIALSIDGFREENDAIRGQGAYDHALESFHLLRALPGLKLKINTVVCNRNASTLIPFMRHIRALGPDYHSLLLLRGEPADTETALPPLITLHEQTPDILEILGSYDYGNPRNYFLQRLKRHYQRYLWVISLKTLEENRCFVPCKAPRLHKVIYPDGAVAMCELMPPSGNLLEEDMDTIEQRMIRQLRDYEKYHGPCFCTHNCNLGENIQTHPRSILAVLLGVRP